MPERDTDPRSETEPEEPSPDDEPAGDDDAYEPLDVTDIWEADLNGPANA